MLDWESRFLITYEAQLATVGCSKPGFGCRSKAFPGGATGVPHCPARFWSDSCIATEPGLRIMRNQERRCRPEP